MTKGRAALPARVVAGQTFFITVGGPKAHDFSVEKHFQERTADTADLSTTLLRSSGRDDKGEDGASSESSCWTNVFITVGGQRPMTSPVEKHFQERTADTADLSTPLRSGRDDKGEGGASSNGSC